MPPVWETWQAVTGQLALQVLDFASEQEASVPPPEPWQVQVYEVAPATLLVLVPAVQE